MCQNFIHFCTCANDCVLENKEQNFWKKAVITLLFKLKALTQLYLNFRKNGQKAG